MQKKLIEIAKKLEGRVLVIGFDNEKNLIKELERNKKLVVFSHLTEEDKGKGKEKKTFFGNKQVKIKRLYKDLGKENYDYIICDFNLVKKYLNKFIKNIFKLKAKEVYMVFDEEEYYIEELKHRFIRYKAKFDSIKKGTTHLITVNFEEAKLNLLKKILIFNIRDLFYDIYEFIANMIIA